MADIHMPSINDVAPWANVLLPGEALLTADDLAALPDDDMLYELVEGRLVQMPPPKPKHGRIAGTVYRLVSNFVVLHALGTTYAAETGFLIGRNPDTVLAPDVAFVRAERLAGISEDAYFPFAPDLAVEVASPDQSQRAMAAKARQWLAGGARLVWIVYPQAQQVEVWQSGVAMRALATTDTLDGADVLPGFACSVGDLF
jgi:Uma2 family endonuclease